MVKREQKPEGGAEGEQSFNTPRELSKEFGFLNKRYLKGHIFPADKNYTSKRGDIPKQKPAEKQPEKPVVTDEDDELSFDTSEEGKPIRGIGESNDETEF